MGLLISLNDKDTHVTQTTYNRNVNLFPLTQHKKYFFVR